MTQPKTDPISCKLCGGSIPRRPGPGRQPEYCPDTCKAESRRQHHRRKWARYSKQYNARRREGKQEA